MKFKVYFYALLTSLTIATTRAQTVDPQLLERLELLRTAMLNADAGTLNKITHPQLSYGHSNGRLEDQLAFVKALVSGTTDFTELSFSEASPSVSGKTGIIRHLFTATVVEGGKTNQVRLHVLTVWTKGKGGWQLLARQAVRLT